MYTFWVTFGTKMVTFGTQMVTNLALGGHKMGPQKMRNAFLIFCVPLWIHFGPILATFGRHFGTLGHQIDSKSVPGTGSRGDPEARRAADSILGILKIITGKEEIIFWENRQDKTS